MKRERVGSGMMGVALQASPELIVLAVAYLLVPIGVGYWVYRDATNRGSAKALNWGIAVFAFGLMSPIPLAVAIALYLSVRGEFGGPGVGTDG
jgi:hypothetical protein